MTQVESVYTRARAYFASDWRWITGLMVLIKISVTVGLGSLGVVLIGLGLRVVRYTVWMAP
jgi:hypothetical protein